MASMGGFPGQDRTHEFNVYARACESKEMTNMDPNAALELLREWAERVINDPSYRPRGELDAAQAWQDLDQWLTKGGFLPRPWDVSVKS